MGNTIGLLELVRMGLAVRSNPNVYTEFKSNSVINSTIVEL